MRRTAISLGLLLLIACGDDSAPADDASIDTPTDDVSTRDTSPADTETPDTESDDITEADVSDASMDTSTPARSEGCGLAAEITLGEWVDHDMDVGGTSRFFQVRLPADYDETRAYPVVYQFHGCSNNAERERNNVPVERESGGDAIHVRGRAIDRCWDQAPDGTGVAMFDALVQHMDANYCADPTRRFVTGYSSGAFLTHRLACVRGDMIRGVASIAGGRGGNDCTGPVAALIIHDEDDPMVMLSASENARNAHAMRNGCDAERVAVDPAPCEALQNCDEGLPVVWCQTSGQNHSRQNDFAPPTFWGFLSSL